MRIAVASEGNTVTGHFGHCEHFLVFETNESKTLKREVLANPGHKPGFLPVFLDEKKVNVIISGGMGKGAIDIFNAKGIEVVVGAVGEAEVIAQQYIDGQLKSTGSVCHEHQHEGDCNNH